jgi:hypothetical protein
LAFNLTAFQSIPVRWSSSTPEAVTHAVAETATVVATAATSSPIPLDSTTLIASLLQIIQQDTGLPWFVTIAIASVATRLALFPLQRAQQRNSAIMEIITPKTNVIRGKINIATQQGNHTEAVFYTDLLDRTLDGHNVSFWKSFQLGLAHAPVLFFFAQGIRTLTGYPQLLSDVRN